MSDRVPYRCLDCHEPLTFVDSRIPAPHAPGCKSAAAGRPPIVTIARRMTPNPTSTEGKESA